MNNLLLLIPTAYLTLYWIGSFFVVYHLIKYGITSWPKKIASVFLAGSIVLSILSFMLFTQINWQDTFPTKMIQNDIQKTIQNNIQKSNTK
jgi:hypothetical protein